MFVMKKSSNTHSSLILLTILLFISFNTKTYTQTVISSITRTNPKLTKQPHPKDIHLENTDLKGKVKSLKKVIYGVVEKDGEINKGEIQTHYYYYYCFNKDGFNTEENSNVTTSDSILYNMKTIYKYDDENRFEKVIFSFGGGLFRENNYKYDDKDNFIEITVHTGSDDLFVVYKYKYDNVGNIIEEKQNDSSGITISMNTFKYDGKENMIEHNCFFLKKSKLRLLFKKKFKYDDRGKLTEMKLNNLKISYKYDEKGYKTEEKIDITLGRSDQKTNYKYDNYGNVIEERTTYPKYKYTSTVTYKYEFDDNNNWIKRIVYLDKKPISITERTIEYYE